MSRTRRLLHGLGFGYANQVLVTAVGLWLTPFLLLHLGVTQMGLWIVVAQLLAYLTLLDLGVIALLPRDTAYAVGRAAASGESEVPAVIARAFGMLGWQVPVIALAALATWVLLPEKWEGISGPLGLALLTFVIVYPTRVLHATLEGLQDLAFVGRNGMIAWALGTIVSVGLVLLGLGIWAVAIGWCTTQVSQSAGWVVRFLRRHRALLPRRAGLLPLPEVRALLKESGWVSGNQLATVLLSGTDLLIIGHFLGPAALVPYTATGKLMSVLQHQPLMLIHVALPGIAELRATGDHEGLMRVVRGVMLGLMLVSGGVVTVVMTVNSGFVSWWLEPGLYGGNTLTALLLAAMVLRHYRLVLQLALFALGDVRRSCLYNLLDGGLSVGLAIVGVHLWGAIGAPIGSLVSLIVICIPLFLRTTAREMNVRVAQLVTPMAPWAWRFALLAVAAAFVARVWSPAHLLALAAIGGATGLAYVLVMYPVARKSVLRTYLDRMQAGMRGFLGLAPRAAREREV